jgi:S-adenosylmethionine uptake transporter
MPADVMMLEMAVRPPRYNLRAALVVICAFAAFSGTDVLVKVLAQTFPVPQVTFMITVAALLVVIASAVFSGRSKALWPMYPSLAFMRAGLLAADTMLIYYAFAKLPLSEAYVLAFLAPVLVAILAFVFLRERLSSIGWLGVVFGFAGVIVALQPGVAPMNLGHAAAVGSALLFAFSLIILRRAKTTESDTALVFSVLAVLSVLSFVVAFAGGGGFAPVKTSDLTTVAAAGFLLFGGHVLLVRAFRMGDASVVAPFQYSQIVWGCVYGALLFGAPIEIHTLAGAAIIIVSGWLVLK